MAELVDDVTCRAQGIRRAINRPQDFHHGCISLGYKFFNDRSELRLRLRKNQ